MKLIRWCWLLLMALPLAAATTPASPLDFSDPEKVTPPPAHAIGFPNRAPDFDALPGFRNPPPGYGEVAFYWWLGDPLTRDRLQWQLDQLALADGVMGLQINYAHSDRGGKSYGLTFPSEPPLFSEEWWKLVGWFMGEAKQRGMAVSLSDYTLGVGQGWSVDEMLRDHPELHGYALRLLKKDYRATQDQNWTPPTNTLSIIGFGLNGDQADTNLVNLGGAVQNGRFNPPKTFRDWRLFVVHAERVVPSLDPMHPRSGELYAGKFFGQFTDRFPAEGGQGLNWFFSDELEFRLDGLIWTPRFAAEFQRRKGYDLTPELAALFMELGPRTPKIRLDYSDVKVALTEEGFFKPVFDWHQRRGMIYGCDHGGRGRNVVEFGDYFRTQRWNQGPGCDQPGLGRDIIKNKVASSIAHLYLRPKVWLEGYYGSGWGTTTAQLTDATFANFVQGQNLLTLHGLYYSTHGGWWEWAPPCNHFRMPYWPHMKEFFACTKRLSFLLSQGHHHCDVAIIYPVAPMEAGLGGNESVQAAFGLGEHLYRQGMDFDFMDFESLDRAQIQDRELRVAGERYRALVLPAMRAIRWSTLQKAVAFARAGGTVIVLGVPPEASDRIGREDGELSALVAGLKQRATNAMEVRAILEQTFPRDFVCNAKTARSAQPDVMHRKIGPRDLYAVYGAPEGAECVFRATGRIELWDPWTGQVQPLKALAQTAEATRLRMPLGEKEIQLIVFAPGQAEIETSANQPQPVIIPVTGPWDFELSPTMDNVFGDFRWPPTSFKIGAEARQFRYADEASPNPVWQEPTFDDSKWVKYTASFGPKFWKLGPLPENADLTAVENRLTEIKQVNPDLPVEISGKSYRWQPYSFSWRWGIENDPSHQGYHGLKEEMSDDFIGLGKLRHTATATAYDKEADGSRYYLWTSVHAPSNTIAQSLVGGLKPVSVYLNHSRLAKPAGSVQLNSGPNPLLLRYDAPGRGYFIMEKGATGRVTSASFEVFSAAARYIWTTREDQAVATRHFRKYFAVGQLPKHARLRITCDNGYVVYLNGKEIGRGNRWETVQEYDVTQSLKMGENILDVAARNDGGEAGLIAEISTAASRDSEPAMLVATDSSWLWTQAEAPDFKTLNAADIPWEKAWTVSSFDDSLWARHPLGPPRLDAPPPVTAGNTGTLAMRWFNQSNLLAFDTRPVEAAPAGWYRFISPPGLRGMSFVARGQVQAWANGVALAVPQPKPRSDGALEYQITVPKPARAAAVVALRIAQERGAYAGAALPEPIALDCGAGEIVLGDWTRQGVLETYSGGAWYAKTITLRPDQVKGRVLLDLGNLASSAEVRINGQKAGIRVAPPWRVDLTPFVVAGDNSIQVLVLSALGGHYSTIPTRYRGPLASGLMGPVTIHLLPQP